MATLTFDRVEKIFSENTHAVQQLNLQVTDGELIVLLGPSGCGKSTILRLVAGLEQITSGTISINDRIVNHIPPERRNTAMVFQNYALYPHKTVRENLAFPLKMLKQDKSTVRKHVQSTAALLGLEKLLDRRPAELSGGQRQRVAMGRALVREPDVFLLDEPLSNLDAKLRIQMRSEIAALQKRLGTTTIYVTHDQVEAMTMGDRLVVLNQGRINQVGTPETLYQRPADVFVASFIGNPGMNLFLGEIVRTDAGKPAISDSNGVPRLTLNIPDAENRLKQMEGKHVIAGLRPESFKIAEDTTGENVLPLQVAHAEELGHENILYLPAPFLPLPADIAEETGVSTLSQASPVTAMQKQTADPGAQTIIAARLPAGTKVSRGETINIHFDTAACQLFDASGREAVA